EGRDRDDDTCDAPALADHVPPSSHVWMRSSSSPSSENTSPPPCSSVLPPAGSDHSGASSARSQSLTWAVVTREFSRHGSGHVPSESPGAGGSTSEVSCRRKMLFASDAR